MRLKSAKGLRRLERKVERERRLGGSIRQTLKYECYVSWLYSQVVYV